MRPMDDATAASIGTARSDAAHTESLTADPEKSHFVGIEYATSDGDKFANFVRGVGASVIERDVRGVEGDG